MKFSIWYLMVNTVKRSFMFLHLRWPRNSTDKLIILMKAISLTLDTFDNVAVLVVRRRRTSEKWKWQSRRLIYQTNLVEWFTFTDKEKNEHWEVHVHKNSFWQEIIIDNDGNIEVNYKINFSNFRHWRLSQQHCYFDSLCYHTSYKYPKE